MSSERTPLLPAEPTSERVALPIDASSTCSSSTMRSRSENHADFGTVIRDVIIGFADGLTVPFALTASLSSLGSSKLVIIGGLAELFSGAVSMGLGAYLAAVTDREHYLSEYAREQEEVKTRPDDEREEIYEIMAEYGISRGATRGVVDELEKDPELWVKFMMDFELKLECPSVRHAPISALTMGMSYFIGGLIPMLPYFFMSNITQALYVSIAITVVILLAFGFVKNYVTIKTKKSGLSGALQTLCVGVLAAGTSYGIVRFINEKNPGLASLSI